MKIAIWLELSSEFLTKQRNNKNGLSLHNGHKIYSVKLCFMSPICFHDFVSP